MYRANIEIEPSCIFMFKSWKWVVKTTLAKRFYLGNLKQNLIELSEMTF